VARHALVSARAGDGLERRFTNMRMGVSTHLEGVMNGIFLVAVGAIWNEVRLSPPAKTAAF